MNRNFRTNSFEYNRRRDFDSRIPSDPMKEANYRDCYRNMEDPNSLGWVWYTSPQNIQCTCKCKRTPEKRHFNQTVIKYFLKALAKSSISGVNSLMSAKNPLQRLIWGLVLVCCLSGFGYQTFQFTRLYNQKPSVVQLEVENDGLAEFPSVTLCNLNRLRRSEYCRYKPNDCEDKPNLTLSEKEIGEVLYGVMKQKNTKQKKLLGHSETMIQSCIFNGEPRMNENECLQNLRYSYDPDYGNCYVIPSVNKAGHILEAREADFWQEANDLSILIDIESEEFMEKKRQPGMILTVHDQRFLPDIHTDGVTISPGQSYHISVTKISVLLLPLPYKTNCTDYESLPWDDDPTKSLTSRLCTVGCSQYYQREKCNNYVTRNLSLFYEKLPYDPLTVTPEQDKCARDVELRTRDYCRSVCGLPCRDTAFEVTTVSSRLTERELYDHHIHSRMNRTWERKMKNLALLKIYYATLEHKIYRHMPRYNTMELFSYLGGYSGVWLGFSLLTVYELIEIIFSTCRYALEKQKIIALQKKFIASIFRPKKNRSRMQKALRKRKFYS